MIYLIGSMKNPKIPALANWLRARGLEVFDDWHSPGPEADQFWYKYEQGRARNFVEALDGAHAKNVFEFDRAHLDAASTAVLVLPAGKSGHLELGYVVGQGKPGYILLDKEPTTFDVMYRFASGVFYTRCQLLGALR